MYWTEWSKLKCNSGGSGRSFFCQSLRFSFLVTFIINDVSFSKAHSNLDVLFSCLRIGCPRGPWQLVIKQDASAAISGRAVELFLYFKFVSIAFSEFPKASASSPGILLLGSARFAWCCGTDVHGSLGVVGLMRTGDAPLPVFAPYRLCRPADRRLGTRQLTRHSMSFSKN